jgi:poly(3-hydroxybutyrate) depolymerase
MKQLTRLITCSAITFILLAISEASAGGKHFLAKLFNRDSSPATGSLSDEEEITYADRDMYIHVPTHLPEAGSRALVVVMHGGLGNAERIVTSRSEKGMNLDDVADKYGFLVAYMNGTAVSHIFGADKRGWNAGYCCGVPAKNNVDDVGYITDAVKMLSEKYGIDLHRVYGIGHSNGAMMAQRIICENGLFAKGISISGVLNVETTICPGARGKSILEIHGADDKAVPLEGGYGDGISNKNYKKPQSYARALIENGGGEYTLQVYQGAEHKFDTISGAVLKQDGITIQEKIARFFDLAH